MKGFAYGLLHNQGQITRTQEIKHLSEKTYNGEEHGKIYIHFDEIPPEILTRKLNMK